MAKGGGSRSGRWRTSTVEVARGPMLAVNEPGVHTISAMVCTQLMKTALLENVFGYHSGGQWLLSPSLRPAIAFSPSMSCPQEADEPRDPRPHEHDEVERLLLVVGICRRPAQELGAGPVLRVVQGAP